MKALIRVIAGTFVCLGGAASATIGQSSWAVAVDSRDRLYFCDIQRDYVWAYEPQGQLRLLFDHNHCHTLTLAYDGNVYGENVGGESRAGEVVGVWRLSPQGEKTFLSSLSAKPDPAIWVVFDAAGNGYAWDGNAALKTVSRILRRTPQGETHVLAGGGWGFAEGSGPAARFGQVAAMAALPDGTLYVVDEGNLRHISIDGSVLTVARGIASTIAGGLPGIGGLYNHHMGAAVDSRGGVYVVDYGRKQIVRWDEAGGARTVFKSGGAANWLTGGGWGLRPTGIAVAGDSLYVMEDWAMPTFAADLVGNPRITLISPDGRIRRVLSVASTAARTFLVSGLVLLGAAIFTWRWARARRRGW